VSTEEEPVFQCPRCHEATGRQDRFAIHDREYVKVIVRCTQCRHRWSAILRAADTGFEPNRTV
jgi:hypothetical protein